MLRRYRAPTQPARAHTRAARLPGHAVVTSRIQVAPRRVVRGDGAHHRLAYVGTHCGGDAVRTCPHRALQVNQPCGVQPTPVGRRPQRSGHRESDGARQDDQSRDRLGPCRYRRDQQAGRGGGQDHPKPSPAAPGADVRVARDTAPNVPDRMPIPVAATGSRARKPMTAASSCSGTVVASTPRATRWPCAWGFQPSCTEAKAVVGGTHAGTREPGTPHVPSRRQWPV